MEKLLREEYLDKEVTWSDVLGPFSHKHDLPPEAQKDHGLIVLTTGDGTEVCPLFQLDKNEIGEICLNPYIAAAWDLLSTLQVGQLDESPWTAAGRLTQPRAEIDNLSWADVLKNSETAEPVKQQILKSIIKDANESAAYMGFELADPRSVTP